ncbi:hypothetical protein B0A55_04535 [Friedmanniomyces simplex]|uniref:Uncharacterized protein n=1 Tax=Friedmanniomyces simplex TaxID=329884 RepID=A0A4V5NJ03_9PEZI|nr:hypothetical protein B0A55_04535 [Friedmanniomyces simplex]
MVAGVEWGSKSVISVRLPATPAESASADHDLQIIFATFASAIEALTGAGPRNSGDLPRVDMASQAEITAYSDMFEENDGILLEDFQEAYEFLQMIPLHVKSENGGRGWPIVYSLLPVEMLGNFLPVQTPQMRQIYYPAPDILDSFFGLFDDYLSCERRLDDHQSSLLTNAQYLPPNGQHALRDRLRKLLIAKQRFRDDFARTFSDAKSGYADPGALRQILEQYQRGDLSPQQIGDVSMSNGEALIFVQTAVTAGALYVGHNGVRLESVLPNHPRSEAYVFYFSAAALKDTMWKPNLDLLFELLRNRSPDIVVAVVDCEPAFGTLDKVRIAQYQAGQEAVQDLFAYRSFMADKCFAECDEQTLETQDIKPPIQRRHVTIACPGTKCSVAKVHEWLCPRCMAPAEYGYSDQYIYCGCGRSLYGNYVFKCSSEMHGSHYTPYDSQQLLRLLNGLVQTNYLNILILGETGVGKSTFINAMVNYLEFESLDEAIDAEKLNYVIPCSFATQIMDRANPNRPIEEKRIKIGARDDERDGSKGDSATQKTTVYPVTFHSGESTLTVRLIDTPGIGDSRGVDADRQNMADILSTLSGYDTVHGILILLKSNNARLTVTFRYCIKELLTHLHHNAAANMAFGFTNTRISNYTPGDTYGPLKALLDQHPDVGLELVTPTTYCFDSESFRYLAAHKSGVTMPNKLDFDRSWSQSRQETIRLIEHFQAIPPHEVKNTISLNGARQLIVELTKPLAEISQLINTNIQLSEDQVEALKDTRIKGDELRNMLHVQKVQMNSEPLSMPRTVCGDTACLEVRDDGKGQNTMVIIYKQHCHPACYLDDVQVDVMAHPGLIGCAAFSGNYCMNCRHHWQQHLHILYELHEETVTVIDSGIQQQLANHADDVTLKQTAIAQLEERVSEYRQEREIIRDAAAKFCVFLKNNSLAPYNDALIAYLDFLIKEEQAKVQAGGNDIRLLSLTQERHKHQEAIEVITRNMDSKAVWNDLSEGGVDRMVQGLYNLKHFGDNLRNLKQGIVTAHEATYRERPYTVKRRNQPRTMVRVVERRPTNRASYYGQGGAPMQTAGGAPSAMPRGRPTPQAGSNPGGITSILKRGWKMGFS